MRSAPAAVLALLLAGCTRTLPPAVPPAASTTPAAQVGAVAPTQYPAAAHAAHTLVHFWATWSVTCRKSLPRLDALAAQHPGTVVIAVSIDEDPSDMQAFVRAHPLSHVTFVSDAGLHDANLWAPRTMPTTYLMDAANVIRVVEHGWTDAEASDLERALSQQ